MVTRDRDGSLCPRGHPSLSDGGCGRRGQAGLTLAIDWVFWRVGEVVRRADFQSLW